MGRMIAIDKTPVAVTGESLNQIWWRGKQWAVTTYGIECLNGDYHIEASRLREDMPRYSWIRHMGEKVWVDLDDFTTAFMVALVLHESKATREAILQHAEIVSEIA